MAHIQANQNERVLAIFEILPELERFLREELAKEQLSEEANAKREEFISKLAALNRAPDLPPRGSGKPATTFVDIREQRELSWRLMPGAFPQASVPYASRKRHTSDDAFNEQPFGRPTLPSISDETGIYEKIPSENGSGKYIEINRLESDGKPPIPDRTNRASMLRPNASEREQQRQSLYEGSQEVYTRDLVNPSRSGPLRDVISHTKNWCVLKSKKLYIFKDVQGPCSQIIDMEAYDIFPQKNDFTLTKPGSPSLVFTAEDDDDHTQWISALERCKYEDLDEIIPRDYKGDRQGGQNVLLEDPDYEVPIKVIEKIDRMELDKPKHPADVYVDMQGCGQKTADDYVDPTKQSPFYESLQNLKYDAELPPIPLSSDEEVLGNYDEQLKIPNGHMTADHSDDRVSGPFESQSSSSGEEPEPPALPPPRTKERSSTDPLAYNLNSTLDRKISNSLGRKFEREFFFNDQDALHVGVLHQRRVLAVWQKRYCKVKNDNLIVYKNADKDEKPALEIGLQDLQFVVCDKETWRSHSFKVTLPTQETYYFAAETYQQLVTWLNVLVKERDRLKFATVTKDGSDRDQAKELLNVANDVNDSASVSSSERKDFEERSPESDTESIEGADSEASDRDEPETDRKKSLKKRSSFLKSQSQSKRLNQEFDIDGTLFVEQSGKWQQCWCKIEATKLELYNSMTSTSPELSIALLDIIMVTAPRSVADDSAYYVIKINSSETGPVILLAKDQREWKKWSTHLKKYAKSTNENAEVHLGLPELPVPRQGERKSRAKKKPKKNGSAVPVDVSDVAQDRKQYNGQLVHLKEVNDETGTDVMCEIRDGFFIVASDGLLEQKIVNIPVRKVRVDQKIVGRSDLHIVEVRSSTDVFMIFGMKDKTELNRLVETLWLQNAQVDGEKGTIVFDIVNQLKKQFKRRSITFDTELKDLSIGDKSLLPRYTAVPKLSDEKAASDSESIGQGRRKALRSTNESKKPQKQANKQSSSSRMSAFFKSLPKRKHKKYDLTDTVDGMPKTQFSGTVTEIKVDVNGTEKSIERHCKVSGKIFYAYEIGNDVKPIFKVPLRSSAIEDAPAEKADGKYTFVITSMEDKSTFKFEVETEEDFDNWYNSLYMLETKSNPGKMSSRESLLDETKSDADADMKPENSNQPFSASNSNSSLSSVLSKQAKSIAGSGDEFKADVSPSTRKTGESDVFLVGPDFVKHSGFLYEIKSSETSGIKSRTKLRRWCVLRQSWVEIFTNKNEKVPLRGIAIGHYIVEPLSVEESGERWTFVLRSDDESFVLCANNEEDFNKWQQEFKKVSKKRIRRPSDTAKLRLKSASDGIKQLLSSSSLPGIVKRDSKRNTIVLDETDEKLVNDFTADIESGNKISGILTITLINEKVVKPKKRFCLIRDGHFCIAKRSKPQKFIKTIDLSKVAILDESDIDKEVFRFRLDFGVEECMAFQAADRKTADNWMVAISMAILLEKLTSPDKFPQQSEQLGSLPETHDIFGADIDELGLVDVSPIIVRKETGSESSNFSNDIKAAIDHRISIGSSYLNPLSNILESAFTPGPYSSSSTPSSREGTLERDTRGKRSTRDSGGEVILEEEKEESNDELSNVISPKNLSNDELNSDSSQPKPGSVSEIITSYEKGSPRSSHSHDGNALDNEADRSQVEAKLADLLKRQEELERERNVILNRLPDLKSEVEMARLRKEKGSVSSDIYHIEEEYEITKKDLARMEKRLSHLEKELTNVKSSLQRRASKLKDPFRRRSAVISPHVIV